MNETSEMCFHRSCKGEKEEAAFSVRCVAPNEEPVVLYCCEDHVGAAVQRLVYRVNTYPIYATIQELPTTNQD